MSCFSKGNKKIYFNHKVAERNKDRCATNHTVRSWRVPSVPLSVYIGISTNFNCQYINRVSKPLNRAMGIQDLTLYKAPFTLNKMKMRPRKMLYCWSYGLPSIRYTQLMTEIMSVHMMHPIDHIITFSRKERKQYQTFTMYMLMWYALFLRFG